MLLNLRELFTAGIAVHTISLVLFARINVTRMKWKLPITMFWEMSIESKLLNKFQWSWYHSFQKTMFYLMKSKYAIFSNIKVTKIERSAFGGTPGISEGRNLQGILWRMAMNRTTKYITKKVNWYTCIPICDLKKKNAAVNFNQTFN